MGLDGLASLTWREALIALVALLVVYVVVVLWRLYRLKHKASASSVEPHVGLAAVSAYAAEQAAPVTANASAAPPPAAAERAPELLSAPSATAFPWNEPPDEIPGQFRIEALERDVTQLRKEVGGLRAEVLVLREELQHERQQVPAAAPISPLYSDAMQMANQGYDATSISEHCGIARAEAELVVALVRNRNN